MTNRTEIVRWTTWFSLCLLILGAASIPGAPAFAQDPAPADENAEAVDGAADEDAAEAEPESLGRMIFKAPTSTSEWFSLFFYLVLGIFSMYALTVMLERLINLKRHKVLPPEFAERLRQLIAEGRDSDENFRNLAAESDSPVHAILQAGIARSGRKLPEVEKAMEDAAVREVMALRSKNHPLNVVGSTAPLVGLLGTVVGMIFAFQISSQEGLGKVELLAKGIYLALLTTAGGLTIAIPCLLLVAMFNSRVDRYFREIDECLLQTIPSFARMEARTPGDAESTAGQADAIPGPSSETQAAATAVS